MSGVLRLAPPLPALDRLFGRRSLRLVERNALVYRRSWVWFVSGFFEPLFYLLGIGFGIGALVGGVPGPDGRPISYSLFVAPALLATSAMNGAIYDSTYNIFFKLKYTRTYDAVLATPLGVRDVATGEVTWALLRGTLYALGFLAVMVVLGLVVSPWLVLALPAAMLIGFAFAAVGMAAATFVRSWQDFDLIQAIVMPLFLFSATFYPISAYPGPLQTLVALTPLYHGVDLLRGLATGIVGPGLLVHVAYLAVMGAIGSLVVSRRLERRLLA